LIAEKKCHFGKNFSVKPRFKSHVGLWQSCRGMYELQLCYLPICSLSSKILSNFWIEQTPRHSRRTSAVGSPADPQSNEDGTASSRDPYPPTKSLEGGSPRHMDVSSALPPRPAASWSAGRQPTRLRHLRASYSTHEPFRRRFWFPFLARPPI
jgi:hypothetical protein